MHSKKRYLPVFFLIPLTATVAFSVTSCGSSSQFLHQQYLAEFNTPLNKDGYLDVTGNKSYYRIDPDSKNSTYIKTNQYGETESGANPGGVNSGLISIYNSIATYIYSVTTSLVNYAHQNISSSNLLGISFSQDGQVTSLSGDFIFAASSTFAFGNSSQNIGFGIATLRFDIVPMSGNDPVSAKNAWTQALYSGQIKSADKDLLKNNTFLKLFEIQNIAILYKFYEFGESVPTPFYSNSSSCLSILKNAAGDGDDQQSKIIFQEKVTNVFNSIFTSSNLKYRAVNLDGVDGFVLKMQNLVALFNYLEIYPETKPATNNAGGAGGTTADEQIQLDMRPFKPLFIFPEKIFTETVEKESWWKELQRKLQFNSTATSDLTSFINNNGIRSDVPKTTDASDKPSEVSQLDQIWGFFSVINDGFSKFLGLVSANHPPKVDETVTGLDTKYFPKETTIEKLFAYFFYQLSQTDAIITPVINSSNKNIGAAFPYYGGLVPITPSKIK